MVRSNADILAAAFRSRVCDGKRSRAFAAR
jgi:hypothetical protein